MSRACCIHSVETPTFQRSEKQRSIDGVRFENPMLIFSTVRHPETREGGQIRSGGRRDERRRPGVEPGLFHSYRTTLSWLTVHSDANDPVIVYGSLWICGTLIERGFDAIKVNTPDALCNRKICATEARAYMLRRQRPAAVLQLQEKQRSIDGRQAPGQVRAAARFSWTTIHETSCYEAQDRSQQRPEGRQWPP